MEMDARRSGGVLHSQNTKGTFYATRSAAAYPPLHKSAYGATDVPEHTRGSDDKLQNNDVPSDRVEGSALPLLQRQTRQVNNIISISLHF